MVAEFLFVFTACLLTLRSIGNNFSLFEQHMFLANLVRKYSIHPAPGACRVPSVPGFGLVFPKNLSIILKER